MNTISCRQVWLFSRGLRTCCFRRVPCCRSNAVGADETCGSMNCDHAFYLSDFPKVFRASIEQVFEGWCVNNSAIVTEAKLHPGHHLAKGNPTKALNNESMQMSECLQGLVRYSFAKLQSSFIGGVWKLKEGIFVLGVDIRWGRCGFVEAPNDFQGSHQSGKLRKNLRTFSSQGKTGVFSLNQGNKIQIREK